MIDRNLPKWVKPGVSFRLNYGPGNMHNKKLHIRGIVDDQAVMRRWSSQHKRWHYVIQNYLFFHFNKEYMFIVKGKGDDNQSS